MQQDWIAGLAGGVIIGLAAAVFLLVNGRIMGASGIIGEMVDGSGRNRGSESLSFLAAMIAIPALIVALGVPAATHLTPHLGLVAIGGCLVGLGTRLANGCTSGHGVCGISRLAPRGIVATIIYILSGGMTVLVFDHLLGMI
jgi:uncharacterized membrane protein YedE/YeeE